MGDKGKVKVDRVACPWLIRNFIDKDAKPGHHGGECSFDDFMKTL
jgi:hypothetical protein